MLAAPGTAGRFIHGRGGNDRLQSGRRRPTPTAATAPLARAIGQSIRSPAFQRGHAHAYLTRDDLNRRTLRRQQSRHDPVLGSLSVSSHCLLSPPPKVAILSYPGGNWSDTGGECWGALLENHDVYEKQLKACQTTLEAAPW